MSRHWNLTYSYEELFGATLIRSSRPNRSCLGQCQEPDSNWKHLDYSTLLSFSLFVTCWFWVPPTCVLYRIYIITAARPRYITYHFLSGGVEISSLEVKQDPIEIRSDRIHNITSLTCTLMYVWYHFSHEKCFAVKQHTRALLVSL